VAVSAGTFLRGALEKVGVDPNIKRIGVYKSAGARLLRLSVELVAGLRPSLT
jgi:hypothetical protein